MSWIFNSQTFRGDVKPFCPCDAGRPQDCRPEEWPSAHVERTCKNCGYQMHQHQNLLWCPNNTDLP